MNYKTIGNTLTPSELNAIQYLLNKNMSKTINVNLSETEVITEYGTLKLTFGAKHYKRRTGFITNSLKMKIIDPLFENMDYNIQLTYKTLNDDLLDNDDTDETIITYNLPANTEVTITEATLDHIINNNAELTVNFNKPLIQKPKTIILNGTEFWIENNQTQNITATILANETPIPGAKVSFTNEGTTTIETTDTNGVATYTYTGQEAGKLNYTVTYEGLTNTFTIYDSFFHNGTFFNASNRITKTTNPDNSVTLYNPTSSNGFYLADLTGTATNYAQCLQFDAPFTLLLKIQGFTGASRLQLYDGNDSHTQQLRLRTFETINNPFIVRVDVYEDKIEYFVNGEKREDLTWIGEMGTCRAGLRLDAGATVTYKDIYLSDITAIPITPVDTVTLTASPASITIGGSTSLTATVTLEDETPAVGRSVSFFDGETLIGSSVTDSNGVASYTYAPLSVGSCTLTAQCGGVESSSVTVSVNKITPTISFATNKSTVEINESYTLSGVLSAGQSKSVKIYEGGTLLDTVTTGSGGAFSKSVSKSAVGSFTYSAVFEGDTSYNSVTSSNVTVTVGDAPTPVPTSITLTGDKSILSYADSQSATLSATVTDADSQVMEGVTVEFFKGSTSMGTATTNSSGVATKTYSSAGVGDVSFTASVGSLVSETYSIEDCKYYSTTEYKQNTDGITLDISLPSTFKLEYDIKPTSRSTSGYGSGCYLRIGADSNSGVWAGQLTSAGKHGLMPKPSGTTQYCTSNTVLSTDNHITIVFDGSTASYTCNDESVSLSASSLTKINGVVPTANNGLKNIKIKPL
ncbi:MAG: Ig-like domain repeat protein [Methanosphaera sp.]|nr:Ig-like domain repeat protein [Methanosphaera sp.]